MSMIDLHNAFQIIDDADGDFDGIKPESLVINAERALGFEFPPTYRKFLTTYGCGDIEGLEFYGLTDDNFQSSAIPNAIWLTLHERKNGLPENLLLIYSTGDGNYIALKMDETDTQAENPVVLISPTGNILERVACDFGEFLLIELQTVV